MGYSPLMRSLMMKSIPPDAVSWLARLKQLNRQIKSQWRVLVVTFWNCQRLFLLQKVTCGSFISEKINCIKYSYNLTRWLLQIKNEKTCVHMICKIKCYAT